MFSQYEASILSKAQETENSRQQFGLASAAHHAGTWVMATAIIVLAAYAPSRQVSPEEFVQGVKPIGLAQQVQSQPLEDVAADTSREPRFFFGFVEFDWDPNTPGGVPGFEAWPPQQMRPLTVVRSQQ